MPNAFGSIQRVRWPHALAAASLLLLAAACTGEGVPLGAPLEPPPAAPTTPGPTTTPTSPTQADSLVIFPASPSLRSLDTLRFRVADTTTTGAALAGPVTWTATGGTIDSTGLFTSTGEASAQVTVSRGARRGRVRVLLAALLSSIRVSPRTLTVAPGATNSFSVTGQWSDGSAGAVPRPQWTASGGAITTDGSYTAGVVAGSYRVIASALGDADTATVTVAAPAATLSSLRIAPKPVSLQLGVTQQFSASAIWSDGSTTLPTVTWAATGGTVSTSGRFVAGQVPGSYRVIVRSSDGTLADTATVTLTAPTLTSITLAPKTVSLTSGASRQFTASAVWSNGTTTAPSLSWTATGGSVSSSGLYIAGPTAGTFRVVASQVGGTVADSAVVTVSPAALASCTVSPATVNLATGATQQFQVTGKRSDGTSAAVSATWSATGGQITSSGLYTAGSVNGTYRVLAAIVGTTISCGGDAVVSAPLTPPPSATLSAIVVTPASATLQTSATQQFSASGLLSDGSSTSAAVTWTASGGTITGGGLYAAPSAAGAFRVIATNSASGLADTSAVTVQAPPPPPPPPADLGLVPELPSGVSLLLTHNGSSLVPSGWSTNGNENLSVQSDGNAPSSAPNVLRVTYPAGYAGGGEPAKIWAPMRGESHIFVTYWIKYSANFYGHPSSRINKNIFFWHSTGDWFYVAARFAGNSSTMSFDISSQDMTPTNGVWITTAPGAAEIQVAKNAWHRVSVEIVKETTGSNGILRLWVDGRKVGERTNCTFPSTFSEFQIAPTWGGGGDNVPATQWFDIDELRVYTGN